VHDAGAVAAELAVDGVVGGRPADETVPGRPARRRPLRRVKRWTVVTHRWTSLVLGLVLVLITTTGAAVVFAPEWTRWTNSSTFDVTSSKHPVSVIDALETVDRAHPKFEAGSVNVYSGLYEVESRDTDAHPGFYGVDPGTGRITGYVNPDRGVMAFMAQVHECFFTCAEYPAYISALSDPMPTLGMHWLKDVTIGGFVLGVAGLLLIFLAVSGIWLWWPTIKRFSRGFKVRTGKGRFARDYDLHQVIGIVAVPFLLIWGVTGASFEFHWVSTAWYSVTGGEQAPESSFTSKKAPKSTPDITAGAALAAAQEIAGPDKPIKNIYAPEPTDPTGVYSAYFASGLDPYRYGSAPGVYLVEVDRRDADRIHVVDYGTAPTLSNKILDVWGSSALHYGQTFNPWIRSIWFLLGLTPLLLAITALSTWLAKRKVRKRRNRGLVRSP
jgi:uncharacterized iron-regulated membrane protein